MLCWVIILVVEIVMCCGELVGLCCEWVDLVWCVVILFEIKNGMLWCVLLLLWVVEVLCEILVWIVECDCCLLGDEEVCLL